MLTRMKVFGLCLVAAAVLSSAASAQQRKELVIATTGGFQEEQLRRHFYDPFEKATGIKVVAVSGSDSQNVARVKAMASAKQVAWDLYQAGEIQSSSAEHRALNEDMSEFCTRFAQRDDLLPGACKASGVLAAYGTTLLVYNRDQFPKAQPRTWADFWNVKDFPGQRALPSFNDPWRVLAAALLADGVPVDKLFPLDLDRAFKKMDEIKPHVGLWWKTGDQSTQGFRSGEYAMGMIWQTRASALRAENLPLEWSLNQAVLVGDRWALIKGAPNRENALRFLEFSLNHIEGQAKRCETSTCTPVSRSALPLMSPQAQAALPLAPEVFKGLIVPDADWINANKARLLDRWNLWLQQ
ncbi:ABC transporter substrate-binding protein [Bosea sp. (in: a-proteobacteria)]|jgi:mannopine transport system substrate-binding protein|uniref:ABC transporter substrate-binding protein n=1 Tax=Bosea sp. (in: a-proteobacteria) TaxID=1871050 RepID=UPI003F70FF41